MGLRMVNTGNTPNDGLGDHAKDAFEKINYNFDLFSKALNLKLERVKESEKWEDMKPNMEIINDNFRKVEDKLNKQ